MMTTLFSFVGGIKPQAHKESSTHTPIAPAPVPQQLIIPLQQGHHPSAHPCVTVGQRVRKGECIAVAQGETGTSVHASTSGIIRAIGDYPCAHPSGLNSAAIVLEADGEDTRIAYTPFDWQKASHQTTLEHLRHCGIVGMGGAVFPSHAKLQHTATTQIDTLIINGAECEPWISCDDRLMRERADEILFGAHILQQLSEARRCIIAVEDNKPEAFAALQTAHHNSSHANNTLIVVQVPTRYPAGGEKQLVKTLTNIEMAHGRPAAHYGIQCFNVATTQAVYRALVHGEPLISRIVTLTGNAARPGNYEVRIGTPIIALLPLIRPHTDTQYYIAGGPMMGFPLPSLDAPIHKGSNCIIAASATLFPVATTEQPCIRCTRCATVCPAGLQPFELYWFSRAKNFDKTQQYHLFDCIECGCCAFVCPAHIPLVDYYRFAKSEIRAKARDTAEAQAARDRFEFRTFRLAREKEEKAALLAAKAAATRARLQADKSSNDSSSNEPDKRALIAAALARAKSRNAAATTAQTVDTPKTDDTPPAAS